MKVSQSSVLMSFSWRMSTASCGEFFGVEASVVADEDGRITFLLVDMSGDGADGEAHVGEGEIVGDESAPATGAEFNGSGAHSADILTVPLGEV